MLTLAAGCAIGAASGLLIVSARIDSFIATLGMSSILLALIAWVSSGQQILGLPSSFQKSDRELLGSPTRCGSCSPSASSSGTCWSGPDGRRSTPPAATRGRAPRGRPHLRVIVLSLWPAARRRVAGMLASSHLAMGDPTIGPGYLLPAFAAAFLGSTQFRGGRFNVWGTVLAVYVLAAGVKGLQLAGAPAGCPTSSTAPRCCSPSPWRSTRARLVAAPPSRAS